MGVQPPTRRTFLKMSGTAALTLAAGCAVRRFDVDPLRPRRHFARVHVAPDRVIRTVVGLRPFRPSGFVLRAERLGDKLLVHDYGHGGGGMTLSWGTAALAVGELAGWTGSHDRAAVIGCGTIGLATARLLQRRGIAVTIYTKDIPPNTTSNIAGAQWSPYSVFDRGRTTAAFDEQFALTARLSHRLFQDLAGPEYGIRWIENYAIADEPPASRGALEELYPGTAVLGPGEHPFPGRYARRFTTMLIESPVYMNAMLRDVLIAGGRIVVREVPSREAIVALDEPVVFNCTGLGARAIFDDPELMPIKGQLTVLLPQPEVDYITLAGDLYMFPRRDGVLLGGTHERGAWALEPDRDAEKRILDGHRQFFERMR